MTIVIFLLVLGLVVFVHELGHFLVAKATGVKVEEFAFGFPPRIISFRHQETRYCINLIPFGGYVKMLGEERTSDDPRSFSKKKPRWRLIIILAGVAMNFLLAIFCLWLGFMIGMSPITIDPQKLPGKKETKVGVVDVVKSSPAEIAGLKPGDLILGFNSTESFKNFTSAHYGQKIDFSVLREGKTVSVSAELSEKQEAPLGVVIVDVTKVKLGPGRAFIAAVQDTWGFAKAIILFLGSFFAQLVQGHLAKEVAGPVGIYQITGQAVKLGFVYVVEWLAILSINLGLINAVPFPALDGGRALFVLTEGIFRRRLIREEIENALHILGFALLLILIAAVTYREVANIVMNKLSS